MSGKTIARLIIVVLAGIALGGIVTLATRPRAAPQPLRRIILPHECEICVPVDPV